MLGCECNIQKCARQVQYVILLLDTGPTLINSTLLSTGKSLFHVPESRCDFFRRRHLRFQPCKRSKKRSDLSVIASSFHCGSIGRSPRQLLMKNGSSKIQMHPYVSFFVRTFIDTTFYPAPYPSHPNQPPDL